MRGAVRNGRPYRDSDFEARSSTDVKIGVAHLQQDATSLLVSIASPFARLVRSSSGVFRKSLQVVSLGCLIGLSLLYPFVESIDRWDGPGPASDTEIQIIVLLTFAGSVFVLARVAAALLRTSTPTDNFSWVLTQSLHTTPIPVLTSSHSPPATLRI